MSFSAGGGGGSGAISAGTDVALSNPANNDVLTYETSTGKWKNKVSTGVSTINNVSGNVVMYSVDPTVRGTSDTTKVVIFICSTQPTAMVNNDIWLSGLNV